MANATVGVLRVLLTANAAEFEAVMLRSAKTAQRLSKDFRTFGQQASAVGQALTKALTVPLLGLGAGAIKAASDFESSFAGVRKTVNATEPEFAKLAQGLRNMAKEVPINVNELNKVAEAAGQLGIKREDILQFTRTMADLGVTTNLTADQAATATAQFQNIFGAAGKDVDRFGATLVALGNSGASTEKDILDMGLRIAGAGHQVGLTQGQVLAFASSLASVGINAEAGGSAISRVFLKINDAVASGGGALAEFARIAGMTSGEFKEAFERDAATATTAFISGLARLKSEGENVNATIEGVVGKNIILKDTLLRASGAGDLLTDSLKLQATAWSENSALTKEAAERYKTFASQAQLLWAELRDVGITLGTALLPVMRDLMTLTRPVIQGLTEMAEWFAKLPEPVRLVSVGMVGLFAAIGPSLWMLGSVAEGGAAIAKAYSSIIAGDLLGKVALGIRGIAAAAVAAAPAILAVAGAVALAAAAGTRFSDDGKNVVATIDKLTAAEKAEYAAQQRLGQGWEYLVQKAKEKADVLDSLGTKTISTTGAYEEFKGAVDQASASMRTGAGAASELTDEQVKHAEAIKSLRASLFGTDDIQRANDYLEALGGVQNVSKLTTEAKNELHDAVQRALDAYTALGQQAPAALMKIHAATRPLLENTLALSFQRFKAAVLDSAPAIDKVRQSTEAMAGIRSLGDAWEPFKQGAKDSEEAAKAVHRAAQMRGLKQELGEIFKTIPQTLSQAFVGGGDFGGAIKAVTSQLGSNLAKMGANVLGITGPWGQAIAGAVGSLLPMVSKLWGGNAEHKKVNDLRDKAFAAAGGFAELHKQLAAAGFAMERLQRVKTEKDWEREWKAATDALKAHEAALQANKDKAVDLFGEIMDAGTNGIPASFRPAIDQLIGLGLLTDEQVEKLRGLKDEVGPSVEQMKSAIGVFKGRIDSLGPAFKQAQITETAGEYINAIDLMKRGGADMGMVLDDAKEELSALAIEALKTGKMLPANLRPYIEELAKSNRLVDENGKAITDLSTMNWGPEMKTDAEIAKEGWDALLLKMQELIDRITGPLEDAIDDVTRDRTVDVDVNFRERHTDEDGYRTPRGERESFNVGTMGRFGSWFHNFGSGTPASLDGIEAVIRPQDAMPFAMDMLGLAAAQAPAGQATTTSTTTNNFLPLIMGQGMSPYEAAQAMVRHLVGSALPMNEAGLVTQLEEVIRNYDRSYGRG